MTKTQFRALVIISLFLDTSCVLFDLTFPNETLDLVTEFSEALQTDWSKSKMYLIGGFGLLGIFSICYSFIGLLLFWNSARLIYLLSFIIFIPVYPFLGISVSSATSLALCESASVLSGVILALIYFSPIKSDFTEKSLNSMRSS